MPARSKRDTAFQLCEWPIVYVRGYAMTKGEIDDTTADPFCGFNIGSTIMRARPDRKEPPKKFIFESPVVRLQSDFGYCDIYEDGVDIVDPDYRATLPRRSIVIHRYYDEASTLLGSGRTPEIEEFARELSALILAIRDRVCADPANQVTPKDFRCYLVAHSMGGLVCRAFLQNPKLGDPEAQRCVDKLFTYATPHNGIDVGPVNVPDWLSSMDLSNFNRERMAGYLDLTDHPLHRAGGRVDYMPDERFPSDRIFCMVGTNRMDYEAAAGLSRTFVGHGSDGLVRIANASVWGTKGGKVTAPCATAYAFRSHSGRYGIVNSEESYQNLVRFLFGDVRVDLWLEITDVRVPEELADADRKGKLDALYQFELQAAPRGKRWLLTRRVAEEDSVAARRHAELRDRARHPTARHVYLSTVFLANRYRVNANDPSLAYGAVLGIRVPDYEVEKRFWPDRHYEGQYIFHDSLALKMIPPADDGSPWEVQYDWAKDDVAQASTTIHPHALKSGKAEVRIPFSSSDRQRPRSPGMSGELRCVLSRWNESVRV